MDTLDAALEFAQFRLGAPRKVKTPHDQHV
jgi:hypothetical protein